MISTFPYGDRQHANHCTDPIRSSCPWVGRQDFNPGCVVSVIGDHDRFIQMGLDGFGLQHGPQRAIDS
jgi:hypothetical protein